MPLPTLVPGTMGLLRVQALGMHPAPHCLLAARRAERHRQSPERFQALAFQGDTQFHRRSRRVTQDHPEGSEPYHEVGPLRDRRMHALALGRAAVCPATSPGAKVQCVSVSPVWTSLTTTASNGGG